MQILNSEFCDEKVMERIEQAKKGGKNHPSRFVEGRKKNNLPRGFGSSTFCAINPKRIAGTCPGDSGK